MDRKKLALAAAAGAILALIAGGCGVGGGDGGSDDGANYRGVTSRAVVGADNVGDLADAAVTGPTIGMGLQNVGSLGGGSLSREAGRVLVATPAALAERAAARSAGLSVPVSEPGDCGGEVSGTVDFRDGSFFEFDATLDFARYCNDGTTVDGRINVSSRMQSNGTLRIVESFAGLTVDDGADSLLLGGTITATGDVVGDSGSIDLDFVVEDLVSGVQAWFDGVAIQVTDDITSESMALSGRVYHSEHGFVDLSTDVAGDLARPYTIPSGFVAPLVVSEGSDHPESGGILVVGEGGTAAILRALNEFQYEIVVDGGDRVFDPAADAVLGPFTWE